MQKLSIAEQDQHQPVIYALCEPTTAEIRYIGKTTHVWHRLQSHLNDKSPRRSARWIRSLSGTLPVVLILEDTTEDSWKNAERKWIAHFRAIGCDLCNHTDGGDGIKNADEEARKRLSATRKALFQNPIFKSRMMAVLQSPERCAKISQTKMGKKLSLDHIAKLPQNQKGYKHSQQFCEKQHIAGLGRKHSAETKARMSKTKKGHAYNIGNKSRTGQTQSIEERLKHSVATKGRPKSEEWKEKMRGRKQTPEHIAKRIVATMATKASRGLVGGRQGEN